MKKQVLFLAILGSSLVFAQNEKGRIGINTETPRATLEVAKKASLPATEPQAVIFPQFSTLDREQMTKSQLVEGTTIYNKDKKCLEFWDGTKWMCTNE